MDPIKRQVMLILLGVGAFVIAAIVLIARSDWQRDLLAIGLGIGGAAIIIVSLPIKDDRNDKDKK